MACLANCVCSAGQLCCIAWAVRGAAPGRRACCELFAITLAVTRPPPHQQQSSQEAPQPPKQPQQGAAAAPSLAVTGVLLMARSALPPHAVLLDAAGGRLVLALEPHGAFEDEAEEFEEPVDHVECRPEMRAQTAYLA